MAEREGSSIIGLAAPSASVVLTYDDGPTPSVTDQLLSVLSRAGATATFFVLLTRARPHRAMLGDLIDAGHEIGLHGPDHRRLTTLPAGTLAALPGILRDAKAELEDLAGVPVRWFRPPYGAQDATTWRATREAELTPVMWNLDCQDWVALPLEEHLRGVRSEALAGRIVLLHDGFADAGDAVDDGPPPALDRVALTSAVIDQIHAAGLTPRSLGEALRTATALRRPWFDAG